MSIYKIPCPVCGGSRERRPPFDPLEGCPDCDKGYLTLEVREKCKPCGGRGQFGPTNTAGLYCRFCDDCNGKGWNYRPMTEEEGKEYAAAIKTLNGHANPTYSIKVLYLRGTLPLFKGQRVRIGWGR